MKRITLSFVVFFIIVIFVAVSVEAQEFTRYLNLPYKGSGRFETNALSSVGMPGKQLMLKYETVPLRNTLRLINRNYSELYAPKVASSNQFEIDISKSAILEEKLIRESDENIGIASETIASPPKSLFN